MIIYYTLAYSGRHEDSHELLKHAIAAYTGDEERAAALVGEMKTGKNGKPYIDGFMHFSISHSGRAWAVLFCEKKCGLDIQYERECNAMSIAERWYNDADAEKVRKAFGAGHEGGMHEFFRIWTRREALIKALGGSVADSSIPPVTDPMVHIDVNHASLIGDSDAADDGPGSLGGTSVSHNCSTLYIEDIQIPLADDLHTSVCVLAEKETGDAYKDTDTGTAADPVAALNLQPVYYLLDSH